MKLPNLESRLPFFLTLPLTEPISAGPAPALVPTVSLLLLLPEKLNRLPRVASGLGCGRVGEEMGDLDRVGEVNVIGGTLVDRSGEVTGDVTDNEGGLVGVAGGPTRKAGRSYGAVTRIDGLEESSDGRGDLEVDAKRVWSGSNCRGGRGPDCRLEIDRVEISSGKERMKSSCVRRALAANR